MILTDSRGNYYNWAICHLSLKPAFEKKYISEMTYFFKFKISNCFEKVNILFVNVVHVSPELLGRFS